MSFRSDRRLRGIPKYYIGNREFEVYESNDLKNCIEDCMDDGGGTCLLDEETLSPETNDLPIVIEGQGEKPDYGIRIMGRNEFGTTIQGQPSKSIFEVKNGLCLLMEDLTLKGADSGTFKPLILGEDDGDDIKHCISRGSSFKNLKLWSPTGASGSEYLMHLKNPWRYKFEGNIHFDIYSGGGGLLIEGTDIATSRRGDSTWDMIMEITLGKAGTGIKIAKVTADVTLIHCIGYIVIWSNSVAGTLGMDLDYLRHSQFPNVQIETIANGVDLSYCTDVVVGSPYTEILDGGTAFKSANTQGGIKFQNIKLVPADETSITAWDVDGSGLALGDVIKDWRIIGDGEWDYSHVANTYVRKVFSAEGVSERWQSATLSLADGYVDVAHQLFDVPKRAKITPKAVEAGMAYVSDWDVGSAGTTCRISCAGLSANRAIDVKFYISERW